MYYCPYSSDSLWLSTHYWSTNKRNGFVTSATIVLSSSIKPHQTHWRSKVIGQSATFLLNRPWNWMSRPQCYYLDVSPSSVYDIYYDTRAERKHNNVFLLFRHWLVTDVKWQAAQIIYKYICKVHHLICRQKKKQGLCLPLVVEW